ncbi:MAG: hypothetical protein DMF92_19175 [Acidobacteria bacterium]|nr:MAG: hypothetical protein DMF92_19175 [Acidobacteriota bacterium]
MNRTSSNAKPNIFPVLRYENAPHAVEWLVRAFGFEKGAVYTGPADTIVHAELHWGPGVIGISSATDATAANPWSSLRQGIYVRIEDVDGHHDRAKAANAEVVMPLRDTEYGSREYSARDLEGYLWGFGTYEMSARLGEATIVPELRYRDLSAAAAWLTKAFGFQPTFQVPGPGETIIHAELSLDDGVIYLSPYQEGGEWSDLTQFVSVYVENPDEHCTRAKVAGAIVVVEPQDTPFGARFYAVRDPERFLWWLSTYKPRSTARGAQPHI